MRLAQEPHLLLFHRGGFLQERVLALCQAPQRENSANPKSMEAVPTKFSVGSLWRAGRSLCEVSASTIGAPCWNKSNTWETGPRELLNDRTLDIAVFKRFGFVGGLRPVMF